MQTKISFEKLYIYNIGEYALHQELNFQNNFSIINGSIENDKGEVFDKANAVGKTFLMEIIHWVFLGYLMRTNSNNFIVGKLDNYAKAKITGSINNDYFYIERFYSKDKKEIKIKRGDGEEIVYDKFIGYDYLSPLNIDKWYISNLLFFTNNSSRFSSMQPLERFNIVNNFLNIDIWDEATDRVKKANRNVELDIVSLNNKINELNSRSNYLLEKIKNKNNQKKELLEKIKKQKYFDINEKRKKVFDYKKLIKKIDFEKNNNIDANIKYLNNKINKIDIDIETVSEKISSLSDYKNDKKVDLSHYELLIKEDLKIIENLKIKKQTLFLNKSSLEKDVKSKKKHCSYCGAEIKDYDSYIKQRMKKIKEIADSIAVCDLDYKKKEDVVNYNKYSYYNCRIDYKKKEKKKISEDVFKLEKEFEKNKNDIDYNNDLNKKILELEKEINLIDSNQDNNEAVKIIDNDIASLENDKKEIVFLICKSKDDLTFQQKRFYLYKDIPNHYKNIKFKIAEEISVSLSVLMKQIISNFELNIDNLKVTMFQKNKKGELVSRLNIEVEKNGLPLDMNVLSSGERKIIDFSFFISLLQLSKEKGFYINCIFLDEISNGLSLNNKKKLVEFLVSFDSKVFFIDHDSVISSLVLNKINLNKKDNIVYINN